METKWTEECKQRETIRDTEKHILSPTARFLTLIYVFHSVSIYFNLSTFFVGASFPKIKGRCDRLQLVNFKWVYQQFPLQSSTYERHIFQGWYIRLEIWKLEQTLWFKAPYSAFSLCPNSPDTFEVTSEPVGLLLLDSLPFQLNVKPNKFFPSSVIDISRASVNSIYVSDVDILMGIRDTILIRDLCEFSGRD